MKIRASTWPYFAFILISLLPLRWFHAGAIIDAIDMGLPFNAGALVHEYLSAWNDKLFAGTDLSHLISLLFPYYAYFAVAEKLFGIGIAQRAEFVILWFLMLSSAYWTACKFGLKVVAASVTACLYVFNFYVMTCFHEGFMLIVLAYAFLPINVWIAVRAFSTDDWRRYARVVAVLSIAYAASGSSIINILLVVFAPMTFAWLCTGSGVTGLRRLWGVAWRYALVNAFWLLPFAIAAVGMGRHFLQFDIHEWPTYAAPLSAFDNLRMFNWDLRANIIGDTPYWTSSGFYLTNPFMTIVLGSLALTPLLIFVFKKTGFAPRIAAVFGLAFFAGVVGSCGFGPPFGPVYTWLVLHVPGLMIFRSTNIHFGSLQALGMAFAIGGYVNGIAVVRRQKIVAAGLAILAALSVTPMLTGTVMEPARGVAPAYNWIPPEHYKELDARLAELPYDRRAAILPQQYAVYAAYTWGAWTEDPIVYWLRHPFVTWPSVTNTRSGERSSYPLIVATLDGLVSGDAQPLTSFGLWALGIQEVVYRSDVDKSFYTYRPMASELNALNSLHALRAMPSIGPLKRFEYTGPKADGLYVASNVVGISDNPLTFAPSPKPFKRPAFVRYDDLDGDVSFILRKHLNRASDREEWEAALPSSSIPLHLKPGHGFAFSTKGEGVFRISGMLQKDLAALRVLEHPGTSGETQAAPFWADSTGIYYYLQDALPVLIVWGDPLIPKLHVESLDSVLDSTSSRVHVRKIPLAPGSPTGARINSGRYLVASLDKPAIFDAHGAPIAVTWLNDRLYEFNSPSAQNVSIVASSPSLFETSAATSTMPTCAPVHTERIAAWLYRAHLSTCGRSSVLVLSQSFDDGWAIFGVPGRHIHVNAFSNGWQIERHDDALVYLLYVPQLAVFGSVLITIFAFGWGCASLRRRAT